METPHEGRRRVIIEDVSPEIEGGRFAVKRIVGEAVRVEAAVFADGHDAIDCRLLHKFAHEPTWNLLPMSPLGNDRWGADFPLSRVGCYVYTLEGWVDHFRTWRTDLTKRIAAAQELTLEFAIGADLIRQAAERATGSDALRLRNFADAVESGNSEAALSGELFAVMQAWPDLALATRYSAELDVWAEPARAGFSSWYELFPRSTSTDAGRHGTFRDCEARLPYVKEMGFDTLYLPPIHPIGHRFRKGRDNTEPARPGDVGSPWAIGDVSGGHTAIHSELGTFEDFQSLITCAHDLKIDIALDAAFQCSPDHPWVREHPEWFRRRPDGSIQYAENPPKKYPDIYPLDFETTQWRDLWTALREVLRFWIEQGIRTFRVDNPHTKSFPFWEWAITSIKQEYPDTIFLAEAFTRPSVMYALAKLGFTQSYTYFTWRNSKEELTDYFSELNRAPAAEYFRGNLWPNTPDILPQALQVGGRPAFMVRLLLAATLGANYGIYGPAFELIENTPRDAGAEEYLNSEKYELKHWDLNSPGSLKPFIARVNQIRHENTALHNDRSLVFHEVDNPNLICYSKMAKDPDGKGQCSTVIVVVNLDWAHPQAGWITLDLVALGLSSNKSFEVHDLLDGSRFLWQGLRDYVELTPLLQPGRILLVRRWARTEKDFDYYF